MPGGGQWFDAAQATCPMTLPSLGAVQSSVHVPPCGVDSTWDEFGTSASVWDGDSLAASPQEPSSTLSWTGEVATVPILLCRPLPVRDTVGTRAVSGNAHGRRGSCRSRTQTCWHCGVKVTDQHPIVTPIRLVSTMLPPGKWKVTQLVSPIRMVRLVYRP